MVVGNFGSGKTELSVNLAFFYAEQGLKVSIADLDIVNPYFRCREARVQMEEQGIRVVVPPEKLTWADLPVIVPEIKGMLEAAEGAVSIFDVGGDDVGARLLSTLVEALGQRPYELWQVINARRPFTDSVAGCLEMRRRIEAASRLKVTAFVGNTHLVTETNEDVIIGGLELSRQAAQAAGLPLLFITAMEDLAASSRLAASDVPVFPLRRHLLPPWIRPREGARPALKPIGRP